MMKSRTQKIKALERALNGDLSLLNKSNQMFIHAVIIEQGGLYKVVTLNPAFKVDKEMTAGEYEDFKCSIPLFS
jgi:hypothetical protein